MDQSSPRKGCRISVKVPSASAAMDKTPTPTRLLLKAAEEMGIFQEAPTSGTSTINTPKVTAEAGLSAVSSTSSNPFDEHFKMALKTRPILTAQSSFEDQEVLNTPQIYPFLHDVVSVPSTPVDEPSGGSGNLGKEAPTPRLRPIAPAEEKAEFLLRMPDGKTVQLSRVPIFNEPVEEERAKRKKVPKDTEEDKKEQLKERNRVAAQRSREKKKRAVEESMNEKNKLIEDNRMLQSENEALKLEIKRLNGLLEKQPKMPPLKIISFNPKTITPEQKHVVISQPTQSGEELVSTPCFTRLVSSTENFPPPLIHSENQRDMLKEAARSSRGGEVLDADPTPSFVRVTPDLISIHGAKSSPRIMIGKSFTN